MTTWLTQGFATFWIGFYLFFFRILGGLFFTPIVFVLGIWRGSFLVLILTWIWGIVLYFLLLQTDAFEKSMTTINGFLERHPTKVSRWIANKFFQGNPPPASWIWLVAGFVGESPLTGVLLTKLFFDGNKQKAIIWILVGSFLGVLIRFTPLYGGGISIVRILLAHK